MIAIGELDEVEQGLAVIRNLLVGQHLNQRTQEVQGIALALLQELRIDIGIQRCMNFANEVASM